MKPDSRTKPRRQSGVIAFDYVEGKLKLMLVTPRFGGKGWLIPKGNVGKGLSSGDSAQKEAFEEAGIEGTRSRRPVGFYCSMKNGRDHRVAVFLLRIEWTHDNWLERGERKRRLFSVKGAAKAVRNRDLSKLLRKLPELVDSFKD